MLGETSEEDTRQPITWADGFGVWHVRVSRHAASPLIAARRSLRDELQARERNVDRQVWMQPTRVPDLDTDETLVYREGTAGRRRISIRRDTSIGDGYSWFFTVEHVPAGEDAMEYGSLATFEEALHAAEWSALHPEQFDHWDCQCFEAVRIHLMSHPAP